MQFDATKQIQQNLDVRGIDNKNQVLKYVNIVPYGMVAVGHSVGG